MIIIFLTKQKNRQQLVLVFDYGERSPHPSRRYHLRTEQNRSSKTNHFKVRKNTKANRVEASACAAPAGSFQAKAVGTGVAAAAAAFLWLSSMGNTNCSVCRNRLGEATGVSKGIGVAAAAAAAGGGGALEVPKVGFT